MYLSEIALTIVNNLNTSTPENWGGSGSGLVVPTDLTAKFALDPFRESGNTELDIFVIPGYIEYNFNQVRKVKRTFDRKFVTVALVARVTAESNIGDPVPVYDVTTQTEAIKLIDLKEDLDYFLSRMIIPDILLKDMETEPIDELEMKDSFFIVTTVLGYDSC